MQGGGQTLPLARLMIGWKKDNFKTFGLILTLKFLINFCRFLSGTLFTIIKLFISLKVCIAKKMW